MGDARLRHLQRLAATGDWHAKLQYNVEALLYGILPPPDYDANAKWASPPLDLLRRVSNLYWRATPETWVFHWRHWYFPNKLGVCAFYDMENPRSQYVADPTGVPLTAHQLQLTCFTWYSNNANAPLPPLLLSWAWSKNTESSTFRINLSHPEATEVNFLDPMGYELVDDEEALVRQLRRVAVR